MDKQKLIEKTEETLRPFETGNLIESVQTLSIQQIFTHPVVLITIIAILFFGIYRRSKPLLLGLFAFIGLIIIVRYTMPLPGGEPLTMRSLLPFIGCGLGMGVVIIYFALVKRD